MTSTTPQTQTERVITVKIGSLSRNRFAKDISRLKDYGFRFDGESKTWTGTLTAKAWTATEWIDGKILAGDMIEV